MKQTSLIIILSLALITLHCYNQQQGVEELMGDMHEALLLKVVSISPTDGSIDVSVTTDITITFNKAVDLASVQEFLILSYNEIQVDCAIQFSENGNHQIIVTPIETLEYAKDYKLQILQSCSAQDGNLMEHDYESIFSTTANPPLAIQSAQAISSNLVKVNFSDDVDWESANSLTNYLVMDDEMNPLSLIAVVPSPDGDLRVIYLTTYTQTPLKTYSLTVINVESIHNEKIPTSGMTIDFTGFNSFIESQYFQILSDSPIITEKPFNLSITAKNGATRSIIEDYASELDLMLIGNGNIIILNETDWFAGEKNIILQYNYSIPPNKSEIFSIMATDILNSNMNGISNPVTAIPPVVLDHFEIDTPNSAFQDQPFEVTIRAILSDGEIDTDYDGTVNIIPLDAAGSLNMSTISDFVDGEVSVNLSYSATHSGLRIQVSDSEQSSIVGTSDFIRVYFDDFLYAVIPVDTDKIRLTWTLVEGAHQIEISRLVDTTWYLVATRFKPDTYFTEIGLTPGETYTYKIEILDNNGHLIEFEESTIKLNTCATTISSNITTPTTWTLEDSPICLTANIDVTSELIIEPGVIVLSNGPSITITSGGSLKAEGTPTQMIVFTSSSITPDYGDWGGIRFTPTATGSDIIMDQYNDGSILRYVLLEYGNKVISSSVSLYLEYLLILKNKSTSGGGINSSLDDDESLTIKNSYFLDNQAINMHAKGGAIYAQNGLVGIYNCIFENNFSSRSGSGTKRGGAISLAWIQSAIISGNRFLNNYAQDQGGAIYISGDNFSCLSNTFISNLADTGGALYFLSSTGNSIIGNTFVNNSNAAINGNNFTSIIRENIFNNNSLLINNSNTVTNNLFLSNTGRALSVQGINNILSNNTILGNGGGIYFENPKGNQVSHNLITENEVTSQGGGIYIADSTDYATVLHNNIFNNIAPGVDKNLYIEDIDQQILTNNYWGGETSVIADMFIVYEGIAPDVSGAVAVPYPLCIDEPANPDCVGANFEYEE